MNPHKPTRAAVRAILAAAQDEYSRSTQLRIDNRRLRARVALGEDRAGDDGAAQIAILRSAWAR